MAKELKHAEIQNPAFMKAISNAIKHFQLEHGDNMLVHDCTFEFRKTVFRIEELDSRIFNTYHNFRTFKVFRSRYDYSITDSFITYVFQDAVKSTHEVLDADFSE